MSLDDFITPIFDRTYEDIQILKDLLNKGYSNFTDEEKMMWATNLKGALNSSDLNRIERNISLLLAEVGIIVTPRIWTEKDIPMQSDFEKIRTNLLKLCEATNNKFIMNVPLLPYNTYQKINEIEKLIFDIFQILENKRYYYYCKSQGGSEIYCGENIGID